MSLVEVHPLTGRHHQIRVHLRAAGVPILFDPLYARGRAPTPLGGAPCSRLALHALRIDVPGASGGDRMVVEAALAPDLVALEELAGRAGGLVRATVAVADLLGGRGGPASGESACRSIRVRA